MKNINRIAILLVGFVILNSCSNESDEQNCPETQFASMKINGVEKQFHVSGRGIDLNNDGGHTLEVKLSAEGNTSDQGSYTLTLFMPYKRVGNNLVQSMEYLRVEGPNSDEGSFVAPGLHSKVTVNKNTCISATFSGTSTIDGNEVTITDGKVQHVYSIPF